MKAFLFFAGSVLALYVGMLVVVLANSQGPYLDAFFVMGFGYIAVVGGVVAAGVIALGGALMLLWQHFIAKNPKVSGAGVVFACIILAVAAGLVVKKVLEPSFAEELAAQRAIALRYAIEHHDVQVFTWAVLDRLQDRNAAEAERFIAASPFTEEEVIQYQLATYTGMDPRQCLFLARLGGRHEDFLAKLPYRLRVRYRSYERFCVGDLMGLDQSGEAFFYAFRSFHDLGATPEQQAPESTAPVFKAASELSADIRSRVSPMFLLLTLPYLEVFRTAGQMGLNDKDKALRRSSLVLLRQQGMELNAEEKQDAELQAALRAANLAELLE
ncbi:hypothetical protein [Corallococcus exiguus]|uniref:Uncharacterized protein n=1 Tax=Corallococcus exiguus TaxID=83462 RepID=A0A7X4YDT2_9BACT|nr:hypothetical protein [Corallococcus exiguus]NBC43345.1 hypothetical protein [Corallococcus exiguus]TNV62729.1 hypothetical protein FH620_17245 [Corallococcus exiguus]